MLDGVTSIRARGLRSAAELAIDRPHGIRLRYMGGCRCLKCRMANTNYETARARARKAGEWNGLVDAAEARAHILKLSRAGVGYKLVAEAAKIGKTTAMQIRSGKKLRIRAMAARRILAVTTACRGDAALISAKRTWKLIGELLEEGFTKARIARELGHERPALQIHKTRVTVRTQASVEALHARYMR